MAHVEIIVRGVLLHAGKVLICRNRKHGHAFLPGGHVEFGEPAGAALEREVREELGIDLKAGGFLGACEAAFDQKKSGGATLRHHEINLVFELNVPRETLPSLDRQALRSQEEHIEFLWLAIEDLQAGQPGSTRGMKWTLLPVGIERLIVGQVHPQAWISRFDPAEK